ncbi:MAG: hypothetical protein GX562_04810 [Coriobacteriaceae bacterium]|nr:hypothetical protein [Coriobacteriaceae bacterium]
MERRDFIKGVGGLVIIASFVSVTGSALTTRLWSLERELGGAARNSSSAVDFTTPEGISIDAAVGPVMIAGIQLLSDDLRDTVLGFFADTHVFNIDKIGAELIMLADGSRSLGQIAKEASILVSSPLDGAGVAEFFVTLGQAGYLQNKVYISLFENRV